MSVMMTSGQPLFAIICHIHDEPIAQVDNTNTSKTIQNQNKKETKLTHSEKDEDLLRHNQALAER